MTLENEKMIFRLENDCYILLKLYKNAKEPRIDWWQHFFVFYMAYVKFLGNT